MDAGAAALALGGEAHRNSVLCPGPGHGRSDRSLSVTFIPSAPDGFLCNSFAGDRWDDCRDHVRAVLGIGPSRPDDHRRPLHQMAATPDAKRDLAGSLWAEAKPIGRTPVETYLAGRGILIPQSVMCGEAIRFHPRCPFRLDSGKTVRLPTMLGAVVDIRTNEFRGVHRTALEPDGSSKAKLPPSPFSSVTFFLGISSSTSHERGGGSPLARDFAVTTSSLGGGAISGSVTSGGPANGRASWSASAVTRFHPPCRLRPSARRISEPHRGPA